MNEEEVKKAFAKVKEDISFLTSELVALKQEIREFRTLSAPPILKPFCPLKIPTDTPTHPMENETNQQITPTDTSLYTPQEYQKPILSMRNEGVPTNQQTDQQTNQHSPISRGTSSFLPLNSFQAPVAGSLKFPSIDEQAFSPQNLPISQNQYHISNPSISGPNLINPSISNVSILLDSLDSIKKDLRLKFKRLTKQEIIVFSTIYSVEELGEASYSSIAKKLSLSESSIRDYTNKLIDKGIPILKEKLDNKRVVLHISPELRKIASLDTIIKLREI